jgi:hypothetical protein
MRTVPMSSFLQPKYDVHPRSVVAGSAGAAVDIPAVAICFAAMAALIAVGY